MSKDIKDMITAEIREWCAGVSSACVVDISGLDAIRTNRLRGALKKEGIRMHVVKNSLARRALSGSPLEPLARSLAGPCTLVYGAPAVTDIAKILAKWAKDNKGIKLKYGLLEGDRDVTALEELSRMKGRTELLGEIAMLISSPGRALAGAIGGPAGRIAGCLKAMADKPDAAASQLDAA